MSKGRIFVTCDIGSAPGRLSDLGYEVEVYPEDAAPSHAEIVAKVSSGIRALVTTLRDRIDKAVLEAGGDSLRVVAQLAVGVDNIDIEAANRAGIPVVHTPGVLTDATAEFAFFMLGCAARKTYQSERLVREGGWGLWHPSKPFLGDEVTGKTVGVIGLGRIGRSFALKCIGLEMDVAAFTRSPDPEFAEAVNKLCETRVRLGLSRRSTRFRYCSLDECLGESDFVSLHLPLNENTRQLIDASALRKMKRSAYLINTARGAVVDEAALARALREGWIEGAALDVYAQEPLPADSPLLDPVLEDRLRLFHHLGSGTVETRLSPDPDIGMAGRCVQGVIDVLEGRYGGDFSKMPFLVNKSAF